MHIIRYLGGVLAPSSHCSILIETPLAGKDYWENDLSIAPMGSTNQLRLYPYVAAASVTKEKSFELFAPGVSFINFERPYLY